MSERVAELKARHAAELALAEAEEAFIAAKAEFLAGVIDHAAYRAVKERMHALRQAQRSARAGDATVSPAPVSGAVSVPMGLPVVSGEAVD